MAIHDDIRAYNAHQPPGDKRICNALSMAIDRHLKGAECKVWHGHPVWFLDGNPIVGYSKLKDCIRLLFWSGQSFDEPDLKAEGGFKAAEARYTSVDQIAAGDLKRWLAKSIKIQWDYKNIVKRKGKLVRLKQVNTMARRTLNKPANIADASPIRFSATLLRPKAADGGWTFLLLPREASARLPSRGQVTVEGTLNSRAFRATLEPDGKGGHWLKVARKMLGSAGAEAGDVVALDIAPVAKEPEPRLPADLGKALSAAPKAKQAWSDITPAARRDFIHWIVSPKQAETRVRRIRTACDMLAKGKRRPCCFDRSGMYSKSLTCPTAEDEPSKAG